MKKMRQEFADTMLEVGKQDQNLVVLVGDISHGILQPFAKGCEGRYFNIGICEPTIVSIAAGMAKTGLIPVIHTIAPFLIERAYEQIKLDFGYHKFGGNFVSVGSAFDYAQLGCSHHCYADISLMSHFHEAQVFFPASPIEFNVLFKSEYDSGKINYFRLPERSHGVVFQENEIQTGKAMRVTEGNDLTLVVIGSLLKEALEAERILQSQGISCEILYYHTIKPFDGETLIASATKTRKVLVAEEASAHDGIFNQVLRATQGMNDMRYYSMAIHDFIHMYGTYEELLEEAKLSSLSMVEAAIAQLL